MDNSLDVNLSQEVEIEVEKETASSPSAFPPFPASSSTFLMNGDMPHNERTLSHQDDDDDDNNNNNNIYSISLSTDSGEVEELVVVHPDVANRQATNDDDDDDLPVVFSATSTVSPNNSMKVDDDDDDVGGVVEGGVKSAVPVVDGEQPGVDDDNNKNEDSSSPPPSIPVGKPYHHELTERTSSNIDDMLPDDDDDVENGGVALVAVVGDDGDSSSSSPSQKASFPKTSNPPIISPRQSLNQIYGNRCGFWQSMSLLLNAGLMVYAHASLSAVFLSNQQLAVSNNNNNNNNPADDAGTTTPAPPNNTANTTNTTTTTTPTDMDKINAGACTSHDLDIWYGGQDLKTVDSLGYCAQEYGGNGGCLLDAACTTECFATYVGYTTDCAACFGAMPGCTLQQGCLFLCTNPDQAAECAECSVPCQEELKACSGLPVVVSSNLEDLVGSEDVTTTTTTTRTATLRQADMDSSQQQQQDVCAVDVDLEEENVGELNIIYDLLFFDAVKTAWKNDARLLAIMVVVFSGIWPYAKNIILMFAWYLPLTAKRRTNVLKWLRRLGKFTLVDVYIVDVLMIGISVFTTLSPGFTIVIKGEPRFGILAFLIATLWEFVHIEWMTYYHEKVEQQEQPVEEEQERTKDEGILHATRFRTHWRSDEDALACAKSSVLQIGVILLLFLAINLFVAGSVTDIVRFTTLLGGEEGCVANYNLYTLATALVSDFFLYQNSSVPGSWFLSITYLLSLAAVPLFVHLVHALVLVLDVKSKMLCKIADISWTFACTEVLVIAVFTVQYKFDDLVVALAGEEGSQVFGMKSELGPGFFILIAYSVFGGLIHYFFNNAVSEYYHIDPYHKVDYVWTKLFGRCLTKPEDTVHT